MLASCDPCLPARSSRRGSTTRGKAPPYKAARAGWAHVRTLKTPVCSGRLPAPTELQASCFRRFCASEAQRRRAFARKQGAGDILHTSAGARASPFSHKSCSHTLLVQSPIGFHSRLDFPRNIWETRLFNHFVYLFCTQVAGPIFETKNRAMFLERFFGRGITAREHLSRQ